MDIKMSGQKIIAMVDSRVTHNFVMSRRATRLGIKLCKDDRQSRVINSEV